MEIHNAAHARGTRNLIIHLVSFASRDVTVGGWRMRQRPRRNRNDGILRSASLVLSLSVSLSLFLSLLLSFPLLTPAPTGLQPRRVSLPRFIQPPPAPSKYRRTLYVTPDTRPDPPTLTVMHYETRNDESAYVSHVMEIPLLIRALNDSATAGYITCIITLMGNVRAGSAFSLFLHIYIYLSLCLSVCLYLCLFLSPFFVFQLRRVRYY